MKKLLFLVVVLGCVSMANAGLINLVGDTGSTINVGDTVNLMISTTTVLDAYDFTLSLSGTGDGVLAETAGGPGALFEKFGAGSGTWQPVNRQNAGGDFAFIALPDALWGYSGIVSNEITRLTWAAMSAQFIPGNLVWGISFTATEAGEVVIDLGNGAGNTGIAGGDAITDLGDLSLTVVPEPMSMALLGLGGLLIRRKKK